MSASSTELLAALEISRADYAKTHCNGDAIAAYGKIAEVTLRLQPDFGAVTLEKLADKPELAGPVLEGMQRLMKERMPAPQSVLNLRVMKKTGMVIPDEENVRRILAADPNLQGVVRYDEFSGDMILARPITADGSLVAERGIPRPWADADTVRLQTYIQRYIVPRMGRDKIEAVVAMHARDNCTVHPVRDYLQSLSWDHVPRLNTWLRDYFGANNQPEEFLAAVGAAWLISAVARIFEPGCQADNMLVLEGAQGIYKSTALRVLAGDDYFSDSLPADLSTKDARDHLRGKWILELAELAQIKRSEIETVKQFVTRRYEQYRPSYGRHEVKFPRQCVFAGSTNNSEYLVDKTGNRRFWTVACNHVELDAIKQHRDQLWAEAAARYRKGERWHLTRELEALAETEARFRVAHDPWTDKVAELVSKHVATPDVAPGEIMRLMNLSESERNSYNATRVANILTDLGWRRTRRHNTRGQLFIPATLAAVASAAAAAREMAEAHAAFETSEPVVASEATQPPAAPAAVPSPPTSIAAPVPVGEADEPAPIKTNGATHDPCRALIAEMGVGANAKPLGPTTAAELVDNYFCTAQEIAEADPAGLTKISPKYTAAVVERLQTMARRAIKNYQR